MKLNIFKILIIIFVSTYFNISYSYTNKFITVDCSKSTCMAKACKNGICREFVSVKEAKFFEDDLNFDLIWMRVQNLDNTDSDYFYSWSKAKYIELYSLKKSCYNCYKKYLLDYGKENTIVKYPVKFSCLSKFKDKINQETCSSTFTLDTAYNSVEGILEFINLCSNSFQSEQYKLKCISNYYYGNMFSQSLDLSTLEDCKLKSPLEKDIIECLSSEYYMSKYKSRIIFRNLDSETIKKCVNKFNQHKNDKNIITNKVRPKKLNYWEREKDDKIEFQLACENHDLKDYGSGYDLNNYKYLFCPNESLCVPTLEMNTCNFFFDTKRGQQFCGLMYGMLSFPKISREESIKKMSSCFWGSENLNDEKRMSCILKKYYDYPAIAKLKELFIAN